MTYYGNARSVFSGSRDIPRDTALAERYYKRAYDLSKQRELKAKAAFMAAKCELAARLEKEGTPDGMLPMPGRWFNELQGFRDTAFHQEALAECGQYQRWLAQQGD
jgi:hypothetical protein